MRLNNGKPIITREMFEQAGAPEFEGANINGPSLIKVPAWLKASGKVAHKDANYYLYFAHHKGKYIRLAWASKLEGPWHLHGINNLEGQRGVLDLGKHARINISPELTIYKHVASPDVFVDDKARKIVMYFHAPVLVNGQAAKEQKSFVADSPDGLSFNLNTYKRNYGINPFVLGKPYFRVFKWKDRQYAISDRGFLYRDTKRLTTQYAVTSYSSHKDLDSWEKRQKPLLVSRKVGDSDTVPRHSAVRVIDHHLWVFYTRVGDAPERILLSRVNLSIDWLEWAELSPLIEVLKPELPWEGVAYPLKPSKKGPGTHENALRDPFIYEEEGKYYLLYTGAGEEAIGLARLYF